MGAFKEFPIQQGLIAVFHAQSVFEPPDVHIDIDGLFGQAQPGRILAIHRAGKLKRGIQ